VLIWINGAFGAGKTSVAEALKKRISESMIYDPEIIGAAIGDLVPASPTGDYQDLPIWRNLVSDTALALRRHYSQTLIVPMTIVDPNYQREIFEPIQSGGNEVIVVSLIVSPKELRRRITEQVLSTDPKQDAQIRQWRINQVDRCVTAFQDQALGHPISNENRPVDETIAEILALLPRAVTKRPADSND